MKKILLSSLLIALFCCAKAQKVDTVAKKSTLNGNNELKLNLIYTVLGLPEINYERIIGSDMGLGVAVLFGVDDNTDINFGVIPHFRIYFGTKKASGFFIEANTAILSLQEYSYSSYLSSSSVYPTGPTEKNVTSFGLGAAAGGKFLTKSGFVGEAYFGLGRIFGDNYEEVYPRFGITIGKRF
jgi:hypothetical protein